MIGSIADGTTTIHNFATSSDSHSTLECLGRLGIVFREEASTVHVEGRGLGAYIQPETTLDAHNSGTTVRMLSGILAACPLSATFVGDESLSRRPMRRIIEPLQRLGGRFDARENNFLPMTIRGASLKAIEYELPVASAQVKSAILLAGVHATGTTRVIEPLPTRNHTEVALRQFGANLESNDRVIDIQGGQKLRAQTLTVPGDISSAAFFIAAALAVPDSRLLIRAIGLNPTRTGFINLLEDMGAGISVEGLSVGAGEPIGNLIIESSELAGMDIRGHWIPNIIDEIPALAVLATRTRKGIRIRDAAELRAKESDRIAAISQNLRALGVEVEEFNDGLFVPGRQTIHGGVVDSFGDHRIAMAFAIAGLLASDPVTIANSSCVAVSFPGFFELLSQITVRVL